MFSPITRNSRCYRDHTCKRHRHKHTRTHAHEHRRVRANLRIKEKRSTNENGTTDSFAHIIEYIFYHTYRNIYVAMSTASMYTNAKCNNKKIIRKRKKKKPISHFHVSMTSGSEQRRKNRFSHSLHPFANTDGRAIVGRQHIETN